MFAIFAALALGLAHWLGVCVLGPLVETPRVIDSSLAAEALYTGPYVFVAMVTGAAASNWRQVGDASVLGGLVTAVAMISIDQYLPEFSGHGGFDWSALPLMWLIQTTFVGGILASSHGAVLLVWRLLRRYA